MAHLKVTPGLSIYPRIQNFITLLLTCVFLGDKICSKNDLLTFQLSYDNVISECFKMF